MDELGLLKEAIIRLRGSLFLDTRNGSGRLRLQSHALISTWISRFVRDEGPEFSLDADLIAAIRVNYIRHPRLPAYILASSKRIERLPYVTLNQILVGKKQCFPSDYEY